MEATIQSVDQYLARLDAKDPMLAATSGKGHPTPIHLQLLENAFTIVRNHEIRVAVKRIFCGFSREGKSMVFVVTDTFAVLVRAIQNNDVAFEYFDLNATTPLIEITEDGDDHYAMTYQSDPYWTLFGRGKNVAINMFMFLMRTNPAISRQTTTETNLTIQMEEPQTDKPTAAARLYLHQSPDQIGIVANPLYMYQFNDGQVGFDLLNHAPRYQLIAIDIDRNSQVVSDTGSFVGYLGKRLLFGRSADIQRNLDKMQKHQEDISTVVVTIQSQAGIQIRLRTELNEQNAASFDEFVFSVTPNQSETPTVPAKPEASTRMTLDDIELLKQLSELAKAGILTEAEFTAKKKQILGI